MARKRAPEREQAKDIWLQSGGKTPLSQIAKDLNVPETTLRSWRSKDGWQEALAAQTPKKKCGAPKGNHNGKGHGAPKGNKNAKGHGAPNGNKNGLKHGAFERFAYAYMDDDEKTVAKETQINGIEEELLGTLAFLKARELRLMKRIAAIREMGDKQKGQVLASVSKTKSEKRMGLWETDEEGNLYKQEGTGLYDGEWLDETTTNTASVEDALNHLESELSKVQAQKVKILAQLDMMHTNQQRLEIERIRAQGENEQSKLANDWVDALLSVYSDEHNAGGDEE